MFLDDFWKNVHDKKSMDDMIDGTSVRDYYNVNIQLFNQRKQDAMQGKQSNPIIDIQNINVALKSKKVNQETYERLMAMKVLLKYSDKQDLTDYDDEKPTS